MKQINVLLIFILFFNCISSINGQDNFKSYKYSKITLNSGKILKANNITISDTDVSLRRYDFNNNQYGDTLYKLTDIKGISIAEKNNIIPGFIIGAWVGVVAMYSIESKYESPQSTLYGGVTYTVERIMTPIQKIGIISSCTILGTIIGITTKRGWKTVFPNTTSMYNNVDLNLVFDKNKSYPSGLRLVYKF